MADIGAVSEEPFCAGAIRWCSPVILAGRTVRGSSRTVETRGATGLAGSRLPVVIESSHQGALALVSAVSMSVILTGCTICGVVLTGCAVVGARAALVGTDLKILGLAETGIWRIISSSCIDAGGALSTRYSVASRARVVALFADT